MLNWSRAAAWYDIDPIEAAQGLSQMDIHIIGRKWRTDFRPAFDLFKSDVRVRNCIAFEYNQLNSFNGSLISVDDKQFLAMEAPGERTIQQFFYELFNSNAPMLVRLTPETENGTHRCINYWDGRTNGDQLNIPLNSITTKSIDYIFTDVWKDGSPANIDLLLSLIRKTRARYNPKEGPLAVHCSAGVGRTGSFIAAYCIIDEIETQLKKGIPIENLEISIERIVTHLSMQRYAMVSNETQYISLYNLASQYIESISKPDSKNKDH